MPAAASSNGQTTVKLRKGKRCRVSARTEQMEVEAKVIFTIDSNRHYRKLLALFATGNPIACRTSTGDEFVLLA